MKKVISVLLALTMVFAVMAPIAFAAKVSTPVIFVGGQEDIIYSDKYDKESETYYAGVLPEEELDKITSGLRSALIRAIAGSWDEYLDGFYDAVIPYYTEVILDNDGMPTNNTGYDCLKEEDLVNKAVNGRYGLYDYKFIYDWRLDPCANAMDLNDYINDVLEVTGRDKVSIVAQGIGCITVLAYMAKYGSDKISELVLDDAALNGSDVYGAMFCDDIKQDEDELAVFVAEARRNIALLQLIKKNIDPENWDSYISVKATRAVYGKLYEITIPKIVRTVYGTMPGFWSLIGDEYYEDAIDNIFEDYEVANENAGLIEKINTYHYDVAVKTQEILDEAIENGVNIYNIVNYGFHMVPVNKKSNTTSDVYISVISQTLGATVAPYGTKLDEDYLAAAADEGNDAYISPDGEIDASTGFIPDHTWFIKNAENREKPEAVDDLIVAILNFNGYTNVFDLEDAPQYLYLSNDRTLLDPLQEGGNADQPVDPDDPTQQEQPTTVLGGFINFVNRIIKAIVELVRSIISFGQSNPFTHAVESGLNEETTTAAEVAP